MADTIRTLSALQTLLANNTAGDISAQDVRDFLVSAFGTWSSYTPAWTSTGTAPAIGGGSLTGRYCRAGSLIIASVKMTIDTTTTLGTGSYRISLPKTVASGSNDHVVGSMSILDASSSFNPSVGTCKNVGGANTMEGMFANVFWTASTPLAMANNDVAFMQLAYETDEFP